jgi:heme-degrading monooxygenase HmoA
MAIGTITRFPQGVGAEQYDAVIAKMDFANEPPEGLIFHSAGELEGRFQVFNVWDTREHFERFTRERLRPAQVAIVGEERVAAMPDAEIIEIAIHNYLIP